MKTTTIILMKDFVDALIETSKGNEDVLNIISIEDTKDESYKMVSLEYLSDTQLFTLGMATQLNYTINNQFCL